MPTQPLAYDVLLEAVRAVAEVAREPGFYYGERRPKQKSAVNEAAKRLGVSESTLLSRVQAASARYGLDPNTYRFEVALPANDEDLPDGREVLDRHRDVNASYIAKVRSQRARMFIVRREPFGVVFFGDMHGDNKGTDLAAIERDIETTRAARLRAVNMGDLLDNFHLTGKLASKQASNRMSEKEGLAFARWVLRDSGVEWDAIIEGNHDAWGGTAMATMLRQWSGRTPLFSWMGRLIYNWGEGQVSVLASHDFKGNSQYNPLHALAKRALEDGRDDAYVAAHRHNAADGGWENGFRDRHYRFMRVGSYKKVDEYAWAKGLPEQAEGAAGVLVIDPFATAKNQRVRAVMDVAEGAAMVQWLRNRA